MLTRSLYALLFFVISQQASLHTLFFVQTLLLSEHSVILLFHLRKTSHVRLREADNTRHKYDKLEA